MNILYAEDLARCKCDHPDCQKPDCAGGLYLQQVCHPHGGLAAMHHEGLLVLSCLVCHATVAQIAVAPKPDPGEALFEDRG